MIYVIIAILIFVLVLFGVVNPSIIRGKFKNLSLVVFGKRGSGKDTLCSYVASFQKKHNSNVRLQPKTNIISVKEILIPNLERRTLTNNEFTPINREPYDKFDNMTFISDCQVYFPSWDDSNLKKDYKDLPITYAIWRHLFHSSLHFNTQNVERLYIILREQLTDALKTNFTLFLGPFVFMHVTYYEDVKNAIDHLKPLKKGLFGDSNTYNVEESKRGKIKNYFMILPKFRIKHDSTYFHRVVFGKEKSKK